MIDTITKLTIPRQAVTAFVLFFFISTPPLISAGAFSVLMLLYLLFWSFSTNFRLPKELISLSIPMVLLIIIGLLNSSENSAYDIAKDVWYVGKSLLSLIIGYLIMLKIGDIRSILKTTVLAATFASLYHLILLIRRPELFRQSLYEFRGDVGTLFYVVSIGIAVIAASRRFSLRLFKKHRWIIYIIAVLCLSSALLAFSRTMLFIILIMLFVIYDLLKVKYLNKAVILVLLVAALSSFTLVPFEEEETAAYRTFMAKLGHTFKEVIVREYEDPREVTLHWRGYESYRALQTYQSGNWLEHLIGQGFGTLIDLGFYVQLGDEESRFIPILHNGYMYLLVKTGLLGVFIYVLYFYKIISYAKQSSRVEDKDVRVAGKFIIAISMVILIATVGIAGFFNKNALLPFIFILGALLAFVKIKTGISIFEKVLPQEWGTRLMLRQDERK